MKRSLKSVSGKEDAMNGWKPYSCSGMQRHQN
jgi:hypothetical protein